MVINIYRTLIIALFLPVIAVAAEERGDEAPNWSMEAMPVTASWVRNLEDQLAPLGLATQPNIYLVRGQAPAESYSGDRLSEIVRTAPPKRILFYAQGAAFDLSLNAPNTVAGLARNLGKDTLIIAINSFEEFREIPFPVTSQRGGWLLAKLVSHVHGVLKVTGRDKVQLDFLGHSHGARTIVEGLYYLPVLDQRADATVREKSQMFFLSPSVASVVTGSYFLRINQMQRMVAQFVPSNFLVGYWDILVLPSARIPGWLATAQDRVHVAVPDPKTIETSSPAGSERFCGDLRETLSPELGGAFLNCKEQHDGMVETSARVLSKVWFGGQPFSYRELRHSGDHLQALWSKGLADMIVQPTRFGGHGRKLGDQ